MAEVSVTPPEGGVTSNLTPPEVATTPEEAQTPEVIPIEKVATKKPRKPRPPKVVAKLATVSETTPTTQEAPLPLEFWVGLMQTQKVIMAQRKSERYNSFRIV